MTVREIKFRIWDLAEEEMLSENDLDNRIIETGEDGYFHFLKVARYIPLQYTGLKDKNGVEIYEGYIVAASFWNDEQKIYSETALVEFDEGSFVLKLSNDEWSYFNGTQSVEVMGNIHKNPELLEVNK